MAKSSATLPLPSQGAWIETLDKSEKYGRIAAKTVFPLPVWRGEKEGRKKTK